MTEKEQLIADAFDKYCADMHIEKFDQALFLAFSFAFDWSMRATKRATAKRCIELAESVGGLTSWGREVIEKEMIK